MREKIFIPKGNNRNQAETWLRMQNFDVPDYTERKLYVPTREADFYWCKDKDIPNDVVQLGGLGLTGSDVLGELPAQQAKRLLKKQVGAIRNKENVLLQFVLLARKRSVRGIECGLARDLSKIRVGTSYPQITRESMGSYADITRTCSGGAEALPYKYDDVDTIYELYQSGDSARKNCLEPVMEEDGSFAWGLPVVLEAIRQSIAIPVGWERVAQ